MTATHANADSLRHHFLVASPWLADPRFHGGVIYLCDHSQEGALGLMVNHPMSLALGEILSQLEMPGADRAEPVYNGGPVQQERGFVLHVPGSFWQSTAPVADDDRPLHLRLADHGAGGPALIHGDRRLDRVWLDTAARRVAARLVAAGVGKDDLVALLMPPPAALRPSRRVRSPRAAAR